MSDVPTFLISHFFRVSASWAMFPELAFEIRIDLS